MDDPRSDNDIATFIGSYLSPPSEDGHTIQTYYGYLVIQDLCLNPKKDKENS